MAVELIASPVIRIIPRIHVVLDQDGVTCAQNLVLSKLRYIPEKNDHTKTYIKTLFIIAKNQNEIRCPSTDDRRINKMWAIFTMKYYSATQGSEILIHAVMWMNFECPDQAN